MEDMNMDWVELETISIPAEDGSVRTYAVVDEFDIDEQSYVVLAPVKEDQTLDEENEYYYRCVRDGEQVSLSAIDDDEEMAWAVMAHNEIFDEDDDAEE